MKQRMIFILIWMFVFLIASNYLLSFSLGFLESIAGIQGYEDTSEVTWLNICYSASFYVSAGFMLLGAVMGFKGWLPGTGFDKDNPYAFAGEHEYRYAQELLKSRNQKITYFSLLKDRKKAYALLCLLYLIFLFTSFINKTKWLYIFASGGLVGFAFREWLTLFQTKVLWPFKMKITDWEKVEELAKVPQELTAKENETFSSQNKP